MKPIHINKLVKVLTAYEGQMWTVLHITLPEEGEIRTSYVTLKTDFRFCNFCVPVAYVLDSNIRLWARLRAPVRRGATYAHYITPMHRLHFSVEEQPPD